MDRSVYDGRSAVWASTLCCLPSCMLRFWHVYLLMYSVHNTKSAYKDLVYLVIYLCVCVQWCIHCQPAVGIKRLPSHPALSKSTFRNKRPHHIFLLPVLPTHGTVHTDTKEFECPTCEIWFLYRLSVAWSHRKQKMNKTKLSDSNSATCYLSSYIMLLHDLKCF